ncbi:MAG: hypothetical protein ABL934_09715 [Lysobacteraceae bacterium]
MKFRCGNGQCITLLFCAGCLSLALLLFAYPELDVFDLILDALRKGQCR